MVKNRYGNKLVSVFFITMTRKPINISMLIFTYTFFVCNKSVVYINNVHYNNHIALTKNTIMVYPCNKYIKRIKIITCM